MAFPKDIGIVDCMLGIPDAEDRAEWFAPFRPLIKDAQTLQQFAMHGMQGCVGLQLPRFLQGFDQGKILRLHHLAHDRERVHSGHPQTVDGLLLDAGRGDRLVQLRPRPVDDDGRQAHVLQEGE